MHFLIRETLSFNLIYVAACYLVGTGMCHNMVGLLQHYRPRGYKTLFMLNSTEQEISTAHRTKITTNEDFYCFKSLRYCNYHANKC